MLDVALNEARLGAAEGGVPIGAALYHRDGTLLGRGRNRRVQENDPSAHAETDAFRKAGRQRRYQDAVMVTTLAPCWYCSGLIIQFRIARIVIGESRVEEQLDKVLTRAEKSLEKEIDADNKEFKRELEQAEKEAAQG